MTISIGLFINSMRNYKNRKKINKHLNINSNVINLNIIYKFCLIISILSLLFSIYLIVNNCKYSKRLFFYNFFIPNFSLIFPIIYKNLNI